MPSVSVRKRNNAKRSHVSRAAQLEAKLENLAELIRQQHAPVDKTASGAIACQVPAASTLGSQSSATQTAASSPQPTTTGPAYLMHTDYAQSNPRPIPTPRNPSFEAQYNVTGVTPHMPVPQPEPANMLASVYQPTPAEAAERLMTFRKYMLIFLPFIYIPETETPERLREEWPFLWFSIMTATCQNVDQRLLMCEATKKFLAQKMIVEHEKNLDFLLGLLVVMGW